VAQLSKLAQFDRSYALLPRCRRSPIFKHVSDDAGHRPTLRCRGALDNFENRRIKPRANAIAT
jgi:hypothetical protein